MRRRKGASWSLVGAVGGGRRRSRAGRGRPDWEYAQTDDEEYEDLRPEDEEYEDELGDDEDDEETWQPRRRRRPTHARRLSLMDLCTPVFACAAVLPSEAGGVHPSYQQFREEVLGALQRLQTEAPRHRIETEDAAEAYYALAAFVDERVNESAWSGRGQWATEPLHRVLLGDADVGSNFFQRLSSLSNRQPAVRELFLVCLALGFRGRYADRPETAPAELGEIKQKLLRSLHPAPLEEQDVLFPEGYEPAEPIADEAPPPPRWWVGVSIGAIVLAVLIWVFLVWQAGNLPTRAIERLEKIRAAQQFPIASPARDAGVSA